MKKFTLKSWLDRWNIAVLLALLALALRGQGAPQDLRYRLNIATSRQTFNFVSWEIETLARKVALGILAPQRFMEEEERTRFVLDYLDQVRQAGELSDEINRAYSDPGITAPAETTREQQTAMAELRARMRRSGLVAEAILGEQVSIVLHQGGFGILAQILPPVSGTFTPLPYMLIVSPREVIQSVYQRPLVAGLTAAEQNTIEQNLETQFPDKSAYVTAIGGLATYPAMFLESNSIDWISDVIAHEWAHHYLTFYPLGFAYGQSDETRAMNETAASLVGEWAGQEVILRFYAAYLNRDKALPNALTSTTEEAGVGEVRFNSFDFNAEMHHTRVIVDQMLAEGKIKEAEWYMEAQRRYFVANGYPLRRLNQAYFAFHGAYDSSPAGGAAGEGVTSEDLTGKEPVGPTLRQVWALSATPHDFLRTIAPCTSLAALEAR
ncbi:MAG TPA: hypothetical protein PLH19_15405 [Anaerolineae bacterium]|nr:hypothetical protein [Anaerolineae bacterium]HQH39899.1 hypothetical protein [Anaerolineae bacterium]